MALKESKNVTVTLERTTVAMLRAKKKGLETWDELMQRLGQRQKWEIECMICGRVLGTENIYESPSIVAEKNGWTEVAVKGRLNAIGFACPDCLLVLEAKDTPGDMITLE
jgi:hypothetical protein